jgi:HD-GYP domain-containing protein (c-di-GMP phosphodiesterase class II)
MEATAPAQPSTAGSFFPVHLDSVDDDILEMDLYIRYEGDEPTLYRARGVDFSEPERERLAEQRIEFLYVPMSQHGIYRQALNRRLEGLFRTPDVSKVERGRLLRAACHRMIEDVMAFPGNPGVVAAIQEVGQVFARLIEENETDFSYVLDMSEHDYYTTTHMVNVGVGCGLLIKAIGGVDQEAIALMVQGGLLHDVGKRGVPPEILNKEGKLTDEEWEQIRRHPTIGYDELVAAPDVNATVLDMTRDHHERLDGKGYPDGIAGEEIGFAARVCAVVDVYDAMSTARPYRGPIPPDETLRRMAEDVGTQFDGEIFGVWRTTVERMIKEDPGRLVEAVPGSRPRSRWRTQVRQSGHSTSVVPASCASELPERSQHGTGLERRMHPRRSCNISVLAFFERQMKAGGVAPGQVFKAQVKDISRGGLQIQTPWPLSLNDLLTVEFPSEGKRVRRRIRVVRVRRDEGGMWRAGACFVGNESAEQAA